MANTPAHNRQATRAGLVDRMSAALNLTPQQRDQAKAIFTAERANASAIRQQLRQERKSVQSAIQTGKPPAEIQQLAKNEGPALADLARMRAAAFARFYAVLTPAQQQKLASLHQQWRQHHAAGAESGAAEQSR